MEVDDGWIKADERLVQRHQTADAVRARLDLLWIKIAHPREVAIDFQHEVGDLVELRLCLEAQGFHGG